MTDKQPFDPSAMDELIGLWADGTLPDTLCSAVEALLAADPTLSADAQSLRRTRQRLTQAAGASRPDDWFVERSLRRLLREHDAAIEVGVHRKM